MLGVPVVYFPSLIKPNTNWSLWNTLLDYTIFNISITLILFTLSYTFIILCTFTSTSFFKKKNSILPFTFC